MSSLFALFALMLAATWQVPMFITYMAQRITGVNHWLRGAIAATQKKPDESKSRPVKGCDENGIPLDPNHHWNREPKPTGPTSEPSNHHRWTERTRPRGSHMEQVVPNRQRRTERANPTGYTLEPVGMNHHWWNTEKSPATEFSRTAPSPYARGRT